MKTPLLIFVAGCVVSCVGASASREETQTTEQRILGGDVDTTTHGVVAILITKPGRTPFTWCSGVVVSPHVVLTAAHCVDPSEIDKGSTLSIYTGDAFTYGVTKTAADTTFAIRDTRMVDGFSLLTASTEGNDLGVAITDVALPVTPLPLNRASLDSSVVGSSARLVGFGDSKDMTPVTAGTRHEIVLPITKVDAKSLVEEGEAGTTCEGDSGGATFLSLGGFDVVAGIHAANVGLGTCAGGANYDTRVDAYAASFVDPIIAATDGDAGTLTEAGASSAGDADVDVDASSAGNGTSTSRGSCRTAWTGARSRSGPFEPIIVSCALGAFIGLRWKRRRAQGAVLR